MDHQGVELASVVSALARASSRTLDPGTILDRTLAVLDPIIGVTAASLWMEEGRSRRRVASRPVDPVDPVDDATGGNGDAVAGPGPDAVVIPLEGADRLLGRLVVTPLDHALDPPDVALLEIAASQIAGALERARLFSEVMELERLKTDFIARVSHELRTPITIINGFLDTLLTHGDDLGAEQRSHMLRRSQHASSRLARLIEELLILSRIDAGVLIPTLGDVDVAELLDEVRRGAQEPEQVLVTVPPGARCTTDRDLLGRALGLLVDNAIKYGGIAVIDASERDGHWSFIVRDRGSGFPDDVRATAFEMFTRSTDTTSVPGLGVGLPIARTLVEVLDGSIHIDATVAGGGAAVRIDLPG